MTSSTSLYHVLQQYAAFDGDGSWLAATIVTKHRSSYRNPGALMLVSSLGQTIGLISGGCLESDILMQARRVQHSGRARYVVYDSAEEGNIAAELGLGCNGRVGVLVQELGPDHREVLLKLLARLEKGRVSGLLQCYESDRPGDLNTLILLDENNRELMIAGNPRERPTLPQPAVGRHLVLAQHGRRWSQATHNPPVSLWVIGGGVDAQPVVAMAAMLGWRVTVVDHRAVYGRPYHFPDAEFFVRQSPDDFDGEINADAAFIMSHNQRMDAGWLARLSRCSTLKYVGLLGPVSRREEVLAMAGLDQDSAFAGSVHGPMGFDIGGDLPESIAVSVIAQCHRELAVANRL